MVSGRATLSQDGPINDEDGELKLDVKVEVSHELATDSTTAHIAQQIDEQLQ